MNNCVFVNCKAVSASHCIDATPPAPLDTQHCHDTYEVLYIISGKGEYLVEGSTFAILPGTLMLIRPLVYHSVRLDPSVQYERYVINFSTEGIMGEALDLLESMLDEDPECTGGRYFVASCLPQAAINVFERLRELVPMQQGKRRLYAKTLIAELIVLLSLSNGEKMYHNEIELGARVIRYLNENLDRDISLDKLAKMFFVSKYYLCRAFKKHNGISIHGYVNQKRVMYAKQFIESGETASAAAYRVGFGDYSSFYRAYVKVIGKAPTAP